MFIKAAFAVILWLIDKAWVWSLVLFWFGSVLFTCTTRWHHQVQHVHHIQSYKIYSLRLETGDRWKQQRDYFTDECRDVKLL